MKAQTEDVKQNAQEAAQAAKRAATGSWMDKLARFGYATKGIVYIIIGWLAFELAFGLGGKATDRKGALQTINSQPFGRVLLVLIAIGLAGYAIYSLLRSVFNIEYEQNDAKGILKRIAYVIVGISYATLSYAAFNLVLGKSPGQGSTASTHSWTARLMDIPFGRVLLIVVGLVVIGVACYQFYNAFKAKFKQELNLSRLGEAMRKAVVICGRAGYSALGIVFGTIGILLIIAAIQHNASEAKGLDGALQQLHDTPFGPYLLAVVALGFIAYGLYSWVQARYRRLGTRS